MSAERLLLRCTDCMQSSKPGFLFLGGADWVECPTCAGTARIEVIRETFKPKGRAFIAGDTRGFTVLHPAHARIT